MDGKINNNNNKNQEFKIRIVRRNVGGIWEAGWETEQTVSILPFCKLPLIMWTLGEKR